MSADTKLVLFAAGCKASNLVQTVLAFEQHGFALFQAPFNTRDTLAGVPGDVLLVSNEIGCGVVPLGEDNRWFVDELGRLNQDIGALADRVTLLVAGQPLAIKAGRT